MEPGSIVEAFDEGKNIAFGLCSCRVFPVMDELGLKGVEEALHRGIIVAVSLAAHRGLDSDRLQARAIVVCGVLDAAIGMVDEPVSRPLPLEGHGQRRGGKLGTQVIAHGPADDLACGCTNP